ncbi:MAG: AAA family ATPase [Candidatus Poribacteria bacterium]|nr:AAA family ATPase [Candidatus Poribacteria bacterium]
MAKRVPTPEELQEDLATFLREKYGDHVQLGVQVQQGAPGNAQPNITVAPPDEDEDLLERILEFNMTPKEVKAYLDRFVIGQDDAKRALSIAICDHYNHIRECEQDDELRDVEYAKQNVLMVGPTGVGKTYLIRTLAKLIGVPFVKADATKFSETGYVGGNVEDLVRDLVTQADGDMELAQYGIVYLDEVDKVATPPNILGRDVSGRGVQMNLLKLLEETEVDLRSPFDPASQMQAAMELQRTGKIEHESVNTKYILFIVSGAFTDLADIVKKRVSHQRLGFGGNVEREHDNEYLAQAISEDFVKFGFEPEFIGRLPVHVFCHPLSVDHLFEILSSSEGSIIKQYARSFKAYGIEVEFEEDGLRAIAERAHLEQTGARGLMTVCERLFRNFKYELPGTDVTQFIVNRELVEDPAAALDRLVHDVAFRQRSVARMTMSRFAETFEKESGIALQFDDEAIALICEKAIESGRTLDTTAKNLFSDYDHGLSLIRRNTGQTSFTITRTTVEDPDTALNEWIRASYTTPPPEQVESSE